MQDGLLAINDLVEKAAAANSGGDNSGKDNDVKDLGDDGSKDKGDGSGGSGGAEPNKEAEAKSDDALSLLLKETNFSSIDELKAHLAKPATPSAKTPEEEKKEKDLYETGLSSFAIEKGLLNLEQITQYNVDKAKSDEDLVFASFVSEFRDDVKEAIKKEKENQGDTSEITEAEILERLDEDFEKEYPLASENEKIKKRAENKLKRDATDLRTPLESSYKKAKEEYDGENEIRKSYPDFKKNFDAAVSESIPKVYSFYKAKDGDDEIDISVDITEDERKKVAESVTKVLESHQAYSLFKKGKMDDLKKMVGKEVGLMLNEMKGEEAKNKLAEKYTGIGLKKGSDVGAKNSFALKQGDEGGKGVAGKSAQEQVIDSTRKK